MGYRCHWLAVRGGDRAAVLPRLGFTVAAELNEEVHDTGLMALAVPGWFVVIGDGSRFMDLVEREQAARLSATADVAFFFTEDSAMCAEVTLFRGGTVVWSVTHGEDGAVDPIVEGALPDELRAVLAAARAEQDAAGGCDAGVDYHYDGVAEIGRALVGFRHDQTLGEGEHLPIYQLEAPPTAPRQPWWHQARAMVSSAVSRLSGRASSTEAAPPPGPSREAVLAAGQQVLVGRTLEAIVNDDGVVELHLVVTAAATPRGPDDVPLDQLRARGVEADDGDELLFPVYYLPDDVERASDQRDSGFAALLGIPPDAFDALQRALRT